MKARLLILSLIFVALGTNAQKFYSEDGKFKINFPVQPVKTNQNIPTEVGEIKMTMFMYEKSLTEAYMAAFNDYPEDLVAVSDPYVLLEGAKNGAVQNLGATIYEEKKITVQGYPAYDFKGSGANNLKVVARIVMVDNRLYQAMYLKQGYDLVDGLSFVNSLEIIGAKAIHSQQQNHQDNPSSIELIEPKLDRGMTVVKSYFEQIRVRVNDLDGVKLVTINGNQAFNQGNSMFVTQVSDLTGLRNIIVEVTDNKGRRSERKFPLTISSNALAKTKPAVNEKRLALLIGNAQYTFGGSLRNPVNDVRAMKKALRQLGFEVMLYENCNQKDMKRAMDAFGEKLPKYQIGLFFYAGHGIQVEGTNYLIPVDAELKNKNDVDYDCIPTGRLMGKMESSNNKTNIIILDACRDNPFERSWSRNTKGAGLAFMNAPSGTLIAYATSPGKTASDGGGQNGLYTSALLHHIHTPNITALQLFQRVRKEVMQVSNNEQTPWESTSLSGDFFFNK